MSARLFSRLSCVRGAGSAARCRVIMQHLRREGGIAAEGEVVFRDVGEREKGAYRLVLLNRPRALNALNLNMIRLVLPQLRAAEEDPRLAMVVMEGAGEKAFCAGGDIRAVTDAGQAGLPLSQEFFREEYWLNHAISCLGKPFLALLDGITMGGGVGLSVHGPFRVATEHAVFAMPETAIGLFPDVGGSFFLPRLRGSLGMYLALTGNRLKGRDLQHAGIATHFIPREGVQRLRDQLADICPRLLALPGPSKRLVAVRSLLDALHLEYAAFDPWPFSLELYRDLIDSCFSRDSVEGILQSLEDAAEGKGEGKGEREDEGGKWATEQLARLQKVSPTSLRITHHELREGERLGSLEECLRMEYRMSQGCMRGADFYEGVRSVLVDKDGSPQWRPSRLAEVGEEEVRMYFDPLPADQEWHLPS